MRHWSYAANNYHETAHISVEDGPWWSFFIEWTIQWICHYFPAIPFPHIRYRLKDKDDIEFNDDNEWTTWAEWCGDTSQWFCASICMPISDWSFKRRFYYSFEVKYVSLKKRFEGESPELFELPEENEDEET